MQRGLTIMEILIILVVLGIIVSMAGPRFIESRREAQGARCSDQLDKIYSICEELTYKQNAGKDAPWPAPGAVGVVNAYLDDFKVDEPCPGGGKYTLGKTLTDDNGAPVVPTCSLENADPNGDGVLNRYLKLHVRYRSFIDGVRNPDLTFAS